MRETGITRRIDELGRVVIPKEIRKILKIKEGDSLEISVEQGRIVLKKFSPVFKAAEMAESVLSALSEVLNKTFYVTDTDKVIAATKGRKEEIGRGISENLSDIINKRSAQSVGNKNAEFLFSEKEVSVAAPKEKTKYKFGESVNGRQDSASDGGLKKELNGIRKELNAERNSLKSGEFFYTVYPIVSNGDAYGSLVLESSGKAASENEKFAAALSATVLSKQFEY